MSNIQVPPDSTGKKVDTVTLSDAGSEVHRQKMVVTGGSGTAEVVSVLAVNPAGTEMGLVVRQAGTASVALAAGANNIGSINNISAAVVLAAGTANIGKINNISATVDVTGNVNISATATVVGTLNVSGNVVVAGNVNIFTGAAVPSASRGPRCVIASTSANVTLIAAPGANQSIFITHIAVSNASGANTRARVGTSASIGQVTMMMAQSAGGFVMHFVPAWEVSVNEAVLCSVKPNASEGIFNVHYFVGSADAF